VTTTAPRDAAGDFAGAKSSVRQVDDPKHAERVLRESDERYRALYADIPSICFTVDQAGAIRLATAFGASQLGFKEDELVGSPVSGVHPLPDALEAERHLAECVANPGEVVSWESRLVCEDGSLLEVKERARAVPDQQCGLIVLIVCEDMTERRTLQSQLAQAHKMEAIGRLAGGIAHDFNNLLTAIRGFAELHLDEHPTGDPGREDVLQIERAAERATQLTQGLLAFSRRADVHPTNLDLGVVAREAAGLLRRLVGEHIVVRLNVDTGVPCVLADRVHIDQVLLNLAANARDAMPGGGQLRIAVSATTLNKTFVKSHPGSRAGRHVVLELSDSGVGMDEVTKAHLFEPFFTTKPRGQGTGLGLASVYGIVKQARGYIDVDSRPGGGSAFRIYLPALEDAAEAVSREPAGAPSHGRGTETILLVEDDPGVRVFAQRVLEHHGYKVRAFGDPSAALEAATGDPDGVDALVTDIVMPTMSGPALAEKMATLRPGLPVLFMSGYEADALPVGAPVPLAKPFGAGELAKAVGMLFGRDDQV
jgi:two-component system cell cycle sensor histidine kinase/response regulator CckA